MPLEGCQWWLAPGYAATRERRSASNADLPRAVGFSLLLDALRIITVMPGDFVGKQDILDSDAGSDVVDDEGLPILQAVRNDPNVGNA